MTKFKQGDKVRHIDNELEMRVVQYQITKQKISTNLLNNKIEYKEALNGKVICSWVNKQDTRQEEAFLENELVLLD